MNSKNEVIKVLEKVRDSQPVDLHALDIMLIEKDSKEEGKAAIIHTYVSFPLLDDEEVLEVTFFDDTEPLQVLLTLANVVQIAHFRDMGDETIERCCNEFYDLIYKIAE